MMYQGKLKAIEKAVNNGTCKTYSNWHAYTGMSKEEFLKGVEWLFEQPETADGKLYREIASKKGDPRIHYLTRVYSDDGSFCCFAENGRTYISTNWSASLSARDSF